MQSSFHLSSNTANKKLGRGVAASTSSEDTCSGLCPFKLDGSCYAMKGPQSWHWSKVSSGERGSSYYDFIQQVRKLKEHKLFRVNVSGDLATSDGGHLDVYKLQALKKACEQQKLRAWTYTHHHLTDESNLKIIKDMRSNNLTINLSCEDRYEAAKYQLQGFNVSLVDDDVFDLLIEDYDVSFEMEESSGDHRGTVKFIACPEQYKEGVTCETCRLCSKNNPKRPVVVFKKH
jgi:hypothetical protein